MLSEQFCDLDCVESGTLEDLITGNKDVKTFFVVAGDILTDTADLDIILLCSFNRHGIELGSRIVNDLDPGSGAENGSCLFRSDLVFKLKVQSLGVSTQNRNTQGKKDSSKRAPNKKK